MYTDEKIWKVRQIDPKWDYSSFMEKKNPQYQQIGIVRLPLTFFSGFLLGGGGVKG